MKTKTRITIIIIGSILLVFAGVIGYAGYRLYSIFSEINTFARKEVPADLKETKVLKGVDLLQKGEFFKLKQSDTKDVILKGSQIKDEKEKQKFIHSETAKRIFGFDDIRICGAEIVAAGKFGGYVFDRDGNLKREILFEPKAKKIKVFGIETETFDDSLDDLRIIDPENDGKCEFISHSPIDGVTIFSDQGDIAWQYGDRSGQLDEVLREKTREEEEKEVYVTKVAVIDLNGDGISEFILSIKNDGIHALNLEKNELWFQPHEYPTADFRVADLDGDGKTELLEFQGMSSQIRDKATGNIIKKIELDGGYDDLLVFEDDKKNKSLRFFRLDNNKFALFDTGNKKLFESDAPLSDIKNQERKPNLPSPTPIDLGNGIRAVPLSDSDLDTLQAYNLKAVLVSLQKDKPKYIAVIASFISIPRANFYVYDEKGNLVYHELLPEEAETIAVLSAANAVDEIIIGGKDTIWKFSVK